MGKKDYYRIVGSRVKPFMGWHYWSKGIECNTVGYENLPEEGQGIVIAATHPKPNCVHDVILSLFSFEKDGREQTREVHWMVSEELFDHDVGFLLNHSKDYYDSLKNGEVSDAIPKWVGLAKWWDNKCHDGKFMKKTLEKTEQISLPVRIDPETREVIFRGGLGYFRKLQETVEPYLSIGDAIAFAVTGPYFGDKEPKSLVRLFGEGGLSDGASVLASMTQVPIVPVAICDSPGMMEVRIGEPIDEHLRHKGGSFKENIKNLTLLIAESLDYELYKHRAIREVLSDLQEYR